MSERGRCSFGAEFAKKVGECNSVIIIAKQSCRGVDWFHCHPDHRVSQSFVIAETVPVGCVGSNPDLEAEEKRCRNIVAARTPTFSDRLLFAWSSWPGTMPPPSAVTDF